MTSYRLFIAIPLPNPVLRALHDLQSTMPDIKSVRWVRPDTMHLTVQFIGDFPIGQVDSLATDLQKVIISQGDMTLQVKGIGVFPNLKRPTVVWAGLSGELSKLHHLHQTVTKVMQSYQISIDQRSYKPHLTLGRTKRNLNKTDYASLSTQIKNLQSRIDHLATFTAREVYLMRSKLRADGPIYTPIVNWSLQSLPPQRAHANSDRLNNTTK